MAAKLAKGPKEFTLDDFLAQMEQVRKMGSISKLLGMLPGHGPDQGPDQQPRRAGRRPHGRDHQVDDARPSARTRTIINGSRRARIARGSGVEVSAVKNLVERFFEARKMMSTMAQGGGMPGMPGMPGMGGGAGRARRSSRSRPRASSARGNPMKRKADEQAAAARREQAGAGRRVRPAGRRPGRPQDFELPDEFKKFMG